ncbi:GntR family transcriptional regulator [Thalassotalea sp. HSM 43]|uniref:GntR family transcriptional regulator n=1 Tax=Thalassotalea sp. HSM 43 TaxID=2552945 RepID=UPI0010821E6A|nr:GntR family transcriptional regulator [Thalassotalea sp. HSM 43]QBY04217.1 GntR family transcriptional regulator [Thalassotalea sp. HSM 43]
MTNTHATLSQQAYNRMLSMFTSGDLPGGTALSENNLAKLLGMSRTPVREAIRQMQQDGIIEFTPRFGATLKKPSADELANMYGVRSALESFAAESAAQSITPRALQQLRHLLLIMQDITDEFAKQSDAFIEGDELDAFLTADYEFHQLIVKATNNSYLQKVLDDTHILVKVFTATCYQYDLPRLEQANAFHWRLYDALRVKDGEAAKQATIEAMNVAKFNALQISNRQTK